MQHHHGIVVKKYRELRQWSQSKLAEHWPKSDGDVGCNTRYVQDIEYGKKLVDDPHVLRGLASLLSVPLFEFGLSDYNPFHPEDVLPSHIATETLDLVEQNIFAWEHLYRSTPLPVAAQAAQAVQRFFAHALTEQPIALQHQERFLELYAQSKNLEGVILVGQGRYVQAVQQFHTMLEAAQQAKSPEMIAHALLTIGVELERAGQKQEAVQYLEQARDTSLSTSRDVMAYVYAYLARCYAGSRDSYHFEQAITASQELMPDTYGTGKHFVYHPKSGILAERSHGYLEIGQPGQALAMRDEIEQLIEQDNNTRLHAWIPLDYARAYLQLGDIPQAVQEARLFHQRSVTMQSAHAISRAYRFAQELEQAGYGDVQEVKAFREELTTT